MCTKALRPGIWELDNREQFGASSSSDDDSLNDETSRNVRIREGNWHFLGGITITILRLIVLSLRIR
jgi:hypothetical protein